MSNKSEKWKKEFFPYNFSTIAPTPFLLDTSVNAAPPDKTPNPISTVSTDSPLSPYVNTQLEQESMRIANQYIGKSSIEPALGPDLVKPLIDTWNLILSSGLAKEEKDELLKKFPTPGNFLHYRAPQIDRVVQTAVLASKAGIIIKKDSYLMEIQNLLGISISSPQLSTPLQPLAQLSALKTSSLLIVDKVNFVAGILAEHVDNWFNLTSDQAVLDIVWVIKSHLYTPLSNSLFQTFLVFLFAII